MKQHYVPASLIGMVSAEREGRLRSRRVTAIAAGETNFRARPAESLGWLNDAFPATLETEFTVIEARFNNALRALRGAKPTTPHLLLVLANYVASLIARRPEHGGDRARILASWSELLRSSDWLVIDSVVPALISDAIPVLSSGRLWFPAGDLLISADVNPLGSAASRSILYSSAQPHDVREFHRELTLNARSFIAAENDAAILAAMEGAAAEGLAF
jgi:hypothetical protein